MTGRTAKSFLNERCIRECAGRGMTREQTAEALEISYHSVCQYARSYGISFGRSGIGLRDMDRAEAMAAMYRGGKTLEEIGTLYSVSRERVRQVIGKAFGMAGQDGGGAVRAARNAEEKATARDRKYMEKLGCGWDEYVQIRELCRTLMDKGTSRQRTPMGAFIAQRRTAGLRGIPWNMKFWEWWDIWQKSGKWAERGRGHGYMMCRFGDAGGYEPGNVYIATGIHNAKVQPNNPYRRGHPDFEQAYARRAEARAA